jgi:hypothetical protein
MPISCSWSTNQTLRTGAKSTKIDSSDDYLDETLEAMAIKQL